MKVNVKVNLWLKVKNKRIIKNNVGCSDLDCLDNDLIECNDCIFNNRLRISKKELKERGLIKYD